MKGTSVTMGTSTSKKAELGKIERMRDAYVAGTTELKLFKKKVFLKTIKLQLRMCAREEK